MSEPKVSVVLISYNEENYIAQALESIIRQKTDFAYEIICHDDASTDATQEIILEYQDKYPELIVTVFQSENKMQTGEHNIPMEYCYPVARGKYIAYCDGDDYWTDDYKLQKAYDYLEGHPDYTMCLHNFSFLFANGELKISDCPAKDRDYSIDEFIRWDYKSVPQIGASMFRKDLAVDRPAVFVKIGGGKESKRPISDQPLYIFLAMHGKVRYFSDAMSVWRRHGNTWTHDGDTKKEINFTKDKHRFFVDIENCYPELPKDSLTWAKGNCEYRIGWLSEDYSLAWKNLKYASVRTTTKCFVLFARTFPRLAHRIRLNHNGKII